MSALDRLDKGVCVRVALCVVLYLICSLTIDGFASVATASSIVENVGLTGLIAAGLMLTMIVGQLDLAVSSIAAVAAIIALLVGGASLALGVALALAGAATYGIAIGFVVARTGVSSLVLTVCMLIGLRGLALVLVPHRPAILPDDLFWVSDALVATVGPISLLASISLAVLLVLGLFMRMTRHGLSLYAVGGGVERARGSGVDTTSVYIAAFAGSAVLSAAAGILAALRSGSASGTGMDSFLLAGVTAAVVGGVSLEGGQGSIANVLLGGLIIRIIAAAVSLAGVPASVESILIGGILLAMLLFDYAMNLRTNQAAPRWLASTSAPRTPSIKGEKA
jgi:ribose/xylose/arabinose/galactoside ABC-type transport system permease subunit